MRACSIVRRIAFFILTLLSAPPVLAATVDIVAKPVPLDTRDPSRVHVGALEFLAGFELSADSPLWGGFSGAALAADGSRLTVVSDKGAWWSFSLRRDAAGRVLAIDGAADLQPMLNRDGEPIAGTATGDAGAATVTPDREIIVALDRPDRLWRYQLADGLPTLPAKTVPGPRWRGALNKSAIAALAALDGDRLLAVSEDAYSRLGDVRGWLRRDGTWSEVGVVPTGAFRPTDMAALPNGDILLLSRRHDMLDNVATRLSTVAAADILPLTRLRDRELAILAAPLSVGNFEAIAARQAVDGSTLIYLLSDDNHSPFQRTLFLQFRWRGSAPGE